MPRLAKALKRDKNELARRVTSNLDREFLYLARHMQPADAQKIRALEIPGVYLMREYRRYYPAGEVAGHIIGFTSVDDEGQEGLELAFDHWLAGEDGAKRVIQDRYGKIVQNVEEIRAMRPGRNLVLSIDLRIQYLAYRELKAAIRDQRAKSGSVIVLDVATGEVLAMVNQPAYNPNDRDQIKAKTYRNRAVTDIVEPGSSIKPFVVAAGSPRASFNDHSIIDTNPGYIKVGAKLLEDPHNLGAIGSRDHPRQELQRRHDEGGAVARARADVRHADALGFGQVTTSRLPGRIRRACCLTTRTGGPWASRRCRAATACRSRRCSWRTPTPPSPRTACRGPISFLRVETRARGRARARSRRLPHADPPARGRGRAGWRRQAGGDPRLHRRRQDRHGMEGDRGWLRHRSLSRGVRRHRAGQQPASRGRGDHRRAGRRQVLRRRCRRAGVLRRGGWRAAPARRAARCAGSATTCESARQVAIR